MKKGLLVPKAKYSKGICASMLSAQLCYIGKNGSCFYLENQKCNQRGGTGRVRKYFSTIISNIWPAKDFMFIKSNHFLEKNLDAKAQKHKYIQIFHIFYGHFTVKVVGSNKKKDSVCSFV